MSGLLHGEFRLILAYMATLHTIGHSSHTAERFVDLLRQHGVQVLENDADVARKSGKALVNPQVGLFGEIEEEAWRSTGVIGSRGFVKGTALAVP